MAIEFKNKPGIVAYLTAGDPDLQTTLEIALAAIDNGADVIELGVPFSDPLADGPVIQRASERAVAGGTRLVDEASHEFAFDAQRARSGKAERRLAHGLPEFTQPVDAMFRRIADDQSGVDGTNGYAGDPIRQQRRFGQRLIDAALIGTERSAALQQQRHARERQRLRDGRKFAGAGRLHRVSTSERCRKTL